MSQINSKPTFVIAALLAGRLYRMLDTTRTMHISSSNAKCISIRGGEKTSGFKPITEFISEMAQDTVSLSSKINSIALQFSRTAANEKIVLLALHNFKASIDKLKSNVNKDQLHHLMDTQTAKINDLRDQQYSFCRLLASLFDDIAQRMRAARIIVTNSRTEASRAGEYQTNLSAIADDLETCSDSINKEIKICRNYLDELIEIVGTK